MSVVCRLPPGRVSNDLIVSNQQICFISPIFCSRNKSCCVRLRRDVFKYKGDAVIVLFPAEYDEGKACKNALKRSKAILEIIKEDINPVFTAHELPEITVRIGLTYGYALVVHYGNNLEKDHIDIIGSSMSLACKDRLYCEA